MKTQPYNQPLPSGNFAAAGWPCPYPYDHATGSANGASPFALEPGVLDAICPETSCAQPLQFCAGCGASNRTLAKFCRTCRASLVYEEKITKFQADYNLNPKELIKGFRTIALPDLQGGRLSALEAAWGYVFVAAANSIGVMANTHLKPPRCVSRFEIEKEETINAFHVLRAAELSPGVVALGTQHIYRLDFLPQLNCRILFRLPDPAWKIAGGLLAGTLLIVRVYHRQSGWQRWLALDLVQEKILALPFQQRGGMSSMMVLSEPHKLLYHTVNEIVQFDLRAGSEYRQAGPAGGLNIKIRPQYYARTGEVFLCGLEGALYRCNVSESPCSPEIFGRGRHELMHMFVHAYDDYLYLLCRDNLVIIDYPSGAAIWNSQQHAQTHFHCGALPPRSWGNYLLFSLRHSGATGPAERAALFSLSGHSTPMLLHPAVAQAPAPVAGITTLIAARRRNEKKADEPAALLLFQF